ncbi:MAG: hypothetical protein WCH99_09965 [Verrucomicrobiota bacterium]
MNLTQNKITFGTPKGGKKRAFSIPMPTELRTLLTPLKQTHQGWIFDFPFQPSRRWQQFFIKMKMPHLTFHCTRVTFITRMHRKGIRPEIVMRLVNHASELIHRIYKREKIEDLLPHKDEIDSVLADLTRVKK